MNNQSTATTTSCGQFSLICLQGVNVSGPDFTKLGAGATQSIGNIYKQLNQSASSFLQSAGKTIGSTEKAAGSAVNGVAKDLAGGWATITHFVNPIATPVASAASGIEKTAGGAYNDLAKSVGNVASGVESYAAATFKPISSFFGGFHW